MEQISKLSVEQWHLKDGDKMLLVEIGENENKEMKEKPLKTQRKSPSSVHKLQSQRALVSGPTHFVSAWRLILSEYLRSFTFGFQISSL